MVRVIGSVANARCLICFWIMLGCLMVLNSGVSVHASNIGGECKASDESCQAASQEKQDVCVDLHERCAVWAEDGECQRNKEYMLHRCPQVCNLCDAQRNQIRSDARDKEKREERFLNIERQMQDECKDKHARCKQMANLGDCEESPIEMARNCAKSCGFCGSSNTSITGTDMSKDPDCTDSDERCAFWASKGECENNPSYMLDGCKRSCNTCKKKKVIKEGRDFSLRDEAAELTDTSSKFGTPQRMEGNKIEITMEKVQRMIEYMTYEVPNLNLPKSVLDSCTNRHELCGFWAAIGECEVNKPFMTTSCAPSCNTCDMIDFDNRCPPLDKNTVIPGLEPGSLNQMFERIVENAPGNKTDISEEERLKLEEMGMPNYTVTVHSRPSDSPSTALSVNTDEKMPPWVISFDDFLSEEECQGLIDLGYEFKFERSKDVGKQNFDGSFGGHESKTRTSENAWCSEMKGCRSKPLPTRIQERIANVTGIPAVNSEDLQLLKYEKTQFYGVHHDYIGHQRERRCGPRILTFFLYLSDVEEGGSTNFPKLGINITPKRGRALLWPSVYNADPMNKDSRTTHEAKPVIAGTKFAANGWIHMYDYVTPSDVGCT